MISARQGRRRAMVAANIALSVLLLLALVVLARDALRGLAPAKTDKAKTQPASAASPARRPQQPASRPPLMSYAPIVQNNIFGFNAGTLSLITPESAGQSSSPAIKPRLMGTIAWSGGRGYAFVIGALATQQIFKSGDEIPGAGILSEVYPLYIVMSYRGSTYEVPLEEKSPSKAQGPQSPQTPQGPQGSRPGMQDLARRTGEGEFVVNKRAIDASLQNPRNIMTDARLLPNMERGAQNGFTMLEIRPGGLYETLGLKNGDILLGVNNFKLTSPEAALQAFTALRGMDRIELEIQRSGSKTVLKYNMR